MKRTKIVSIIGTRPQFIKASVVSRAIRRHYEEIILHTGQHYDIEMSARFFNELKLPMPDYNLGVGSASQAKQVGSMLEKIEKVLLKEKPGIILVYGDTNSTLAGVLAGSKLNIPIAHIEAGLRSYRKDMPEEINRVVADHLSTLLFCPTKNAVKNLQKEGIIKDVYNVGDVMYDALLYYIDLANRGSKILSQLNLCSNSYFLATIHRAENTNLRERLEKIMAVLGELNNSVVFPIHPRTKNALEKFKIRKRYPNIKFIKPISYFDMLVLEANAKAILTDSGGVQKEAYFLNIPCLTLRDVTEWTETIESGGNEVVGIDRSKIIRAINEFNSRKIRNNLKHFGNGRASEKILGILQRNRSMFL